MKAINSEPLTDLLHTENDHWNDFAYRLHCEATENGLFTDVTEPLTIVAAGTDILAEYAEDPAKGVEVFLAEILLSELTKPQLLFVYSCVNKYLSNTEFDGKVLTQAKELLYSHIKRLKKETEPARPIVKNIREVLKAQIEKELQTLPEMLKDLEPEKRLNIICKLIPFVLPKVESIDSETGEP